MTTGRRRSAPLTRGGLIVVRLHRHRLPSKKSYNARWQWCGPIPRNGLHFEADGAQRLQHGGWFNKSKPVNLGVTSIQTPHQPEAGDGAGQQSRSRLQVGLYQHRPIGPRRKRSMWLARPRTLGRRDVEQQHPAWHKRLVHSSKQIGSRRVIVRRVEDVVENLADRSNGHAPRQVGGHERSNLERRLWCPRSRECHHRLGHIDAHDVISSLNQRARQNTATATEIYHRAVLTLSTGELIDQSPGGLAGHNSVAGVVNIGQVLAICVRNWHGCPYAV